MDEKPLFWVGSSQADMRAFPKDAKRNGGHQLHLVQQGFEPLDFNPMPSVGPGVYELRIHAGTEHRVFYIAKFSEAVYVLHAFEKRTRKTANRDIDLGTSRLSIVLNSRRERPPGGRSK